MLQGYIFGGVVAGPLGWRSAFWIEAAAMLPFVLFSALAPPIGLKGMHTGVNLTPKQAFADGVKQRSSAESSPSQGNAWLQGHQHQQNCSVCQEFACTARRSWSYSDEMSCSEGAAALHTCADSSSLLAVDGRSLEVWFRAESMGL